MNIIVELRQWFGNFTRTDKSAIKSKIILNKRPQDLATWQLAEALHKPIIIKFEKQKLHSSSNGNIWGVDLEDFIKLINKYNKGFRFLLCVINIFSRYTWVVPVRHKKGITNAKAFYKGFDRLDMGRKR